MNTRLTQDDIKNKVEWINKGLESSNAKYRLVVIYMNGFCNVYKATLEQISRDCVETLLFSGTKREVWTFLKGIQYRSEL